MMKSFAKMVVIAALVAAPVASFAQSNQSSVTRAQVRAELLQYEKAGYNPNGDWINYPENIHAAQAKIAAENATARAATSGYGGAADGKSRSGTSNGQ
jgi:hypothetical protein